MPAFRLRALTRCCGVPSTRETVSPLRWSHFSCSRVQVSSATRFGAITSTFETAKSSISSLMAVRVITVFPSPMSRNSPTFSWP